MRGIESDDRFYLKLQEKHGPTFKLFWGSRDLKMCFVGFDRGRRLLTENWKLLSSVNTDLTPVVPGDYLRSMGGQPHARYRRAFTGALRDDLVDAGSEQFRDVVHVQLTRLAESELGGDPAHCLTETLNQIVTRTLFLLIYGIKPTSRLADDLYDLYCKLGPNGYIEDVGQEQAELYRKIRPQISQMCHSVRSDGESEIEDSVIRRLVTQFPDADLDETLIGNAIFMVERGRHDLRDLLRWIVHYLSYNPSVVAELRDDTTQCGGTFSLAEACVMETLRLDQAETLNRRAIEAFDFEGYHVPKNSWVSVLMRETHRDSEVFDEPDRFRPQRFFENSYSADEYSPFGVDAHRCIASSFVTRIGGIFIEELTRVFQWEVLADGPRHYGHFHWQPAQSFAIKLTKG